MARSSELIPAGPLLDQGTFVLADRLVRALDYALGRAVKRTQAYHAIYDMASLPLERDADLLEDALEGARQCQGALRKLAEAWAETCCCHCGEPIVFRRAERDPYDPDGQRHVCPGMRKGVLSVQ